MTKIILAFGRLVFCFLRRQFGREGKKVRERNVEGRQVGYK